MIDLFINILEFGYETYKDGPKRLGWLLNLVNATVSKVGSPDQSALDCFFIEQNGNLFKSDVLCFFTHEFCCRLDILNI